jgi:hypothetical protein
MRIVLSAKLLALAGCGLVVGLLIWVVLAAMPTREPSWKGHRLSEWIDAFDSHGRFDDGDYRRSAFSDEEIDRALRGIGPAGLPSLGYWLTAKPGWLKLRLNQQLQRQHWILFRLGDDRDLQILAETGFLAYGTNAQPLLPVLIKLSHNRDSELRMAAYGAAFSIRPDKEIFLSLAFRALKEEDKHIQAMAAQWMVERFPDEAEKSGLPSRFPIFFESALDKDGPPHKQHPKP